MDEIFSRVDKGQLIQTALIKTTGNKYQKKHKTYRINRYCLINLFQSNVFCLYPLIFSEGRRIEHRLEKC